MGEACSDEAEEHSFSSLPLASNPFSFVTEIFHFLVELFLLSPLNVCVDFSSPTRREGEQAKHLCYFFLREERKRL